MKDYQTDKTLGLFGYYKNLLSPFQSEKIKLLEIGVDRGGSLELWSDYFNHPETKIVGIDLTLPRVEFCDRIKVVQADQNDSLRLKEVAEELGPFDIIVDDGSHKTRETKNCFDCLWPYLVSGGYYIIEDWGVGYFQPGDGSYVDGGKGMVELVTSLLIAAPQLGIQSSRVIAEKGVFFAAFRKL